MFLLEYVFRCSGKRLGTQLLVFYSMQDAKKIMIYALTPSSLLLHHKILYCYWAMLNFFEPCLAFGTREYNCYFVLSSTKLCLLVYCCLLWIMVPSSWPAVTPLCFMNSLSTGHVSYIKLHFPFSIQGLFFLSGAWINGSVFSCSSIYSFIASMLLESGHRSILAW